MTLIVNGVKKVVKRAEKELRIKPRLGKAAKKLKVRGKGFEVPDFKELSTSTYEVDKMVAVYEEKRDSLHITHDRLFNVVRAHLPMDFATTYIVLDKYGLIPDVGTRVLAVRELAPRHRKSVMEKATSLGWVRPKEESSLVRLHEAEFSIDIPKFFKRYGDRWKDIVSLWVTEGIDKDERLVDSFKATQVPFLRGVPSVWQPYNAHAIWLTNTGVGKSVFDSIAGNVTGIDISIAGLFGGSLDNYSKQQVGALSGSGFFLIDEIEQLTKYEYSKSILLSLLGYLEQGSVSRRLKVPIKCEGTKSVVFASNPASSDPLESIHRFFAILQSDADPMRLGRRMSSVLIGSDFKTTLDVEGVVSSIRSIMPRFLHMTCLKYWNNKTESLLKHGLRYADLAEKEDTSIANTILAKAATCPSPQVKQFMKGMSLALRRVRMSAFRIAVLDSMDILVNRGYRVCLNRVLEEVEPIYSRLVDANLRSLDELTISLSDLEPTRECARKIHEQFPKLSSREIAVMIKMSHVTVSKWLKE